jgi:hypothetical protein
MIVWLKENFQVTGKTCDKVLILLVPPNSWSIRNIQHKFKVSSSMVWTVKKLVAEKIIFSSPNLKLGNVLPPATAEMVK